MLLRWSSSEFETSWGDGGGGGGRGKQEEEK